MEGFSEPIYSFYGHMEADGFVKEGDRVKRRQKIGTLGDPVTFTPHLHFEIKNRTALTNPPFSSCTDKDSGRYISAGYSGLENDYGGGDYYDPSDGITGNRYYHPSKFIEKYKNVAPVPNPRVMDFSSEYAAGWADKVLDGKHGFCNDGEWATKGTSQGWIRLEVKADIESVLIYDRACPEQVVAGTVELDTGERFPFGPLEDSGHQPTRVNVNRQGVVWIKVNIEKSTGGPNPGIGEIVIVRGKPGPIEDCSRFVKDMNYPDGTRVPAGETIRKGWQLSNCGDTTWSTAAGYRGVRTAGSFGPTEFEIPSVAPGQNGDLYADITVPSTAGIHRATYMLEGPRGRFGQEFWVEVDVDPQSPPPGPRVIGFSSEYAEGWADKVLDGNYGTCNSGEWATQGQSRGWVQIQVQADIGSVRIYDRACPEQVMAGTIELNTGETFPFGPLEDSGSTPTQVPVNRQEVAWIKVHINVSAGGPNPGIGEIEILAESPPGEDCAKFVADLNYPDGTVVPGGETIHKGWRLSNCGDTTWSTIGGYRTVRTGGNFGPDAFGIPSVASGQNGDLYVDMAVPSAAGTYRGTYQLEGPSGRFGEPFWVEVVVSIPSNDCSRFVSDLSYPDGTGVEPGQTIYKGWRLTNCGDTTWWSDNGYRAVRVGGSFGPTSFRIPTVSSGQTGDLFAYITVPTTEGTHRATYQLENPRGRFGDPFWVEIVVRDPSTATVVVDDGDSGFKQFGPSEYWHREYIGYLGDMYWTYVNGSVVSNKVQWQPNLSRAGSYKVQVFVPYNHATTSSARYTIRANGGVFHASVNQNGFYDAWVTLGTYYFNGANDGTEYVELTDATGEPANSLRKIGFDAVRWVKQ